MTNPAGGTTTYTYAPVSKPYFIEGITDARGITYLTNTYCSGSNCPPDPAVVTQTAADGGGTRFDYVVTNLTVMQATVTDPRGHQSVHRFNSRGVPSACPGWGGTANGKSFLMSRRAEQVS